jgi:hypothetical protein
MKLTGAGDEVGRMFTAVTASTSFESPRTSDSSGHPQTSANVVEGAFYYGHCKEAREEDRQEVAEGEGQDDQEEQVICSRRWSPEN